MFGWIVRWFRRDPDRSRLLFAYRDGTRVRWADPVLVERTLIDRLGDDWWQVVADLSKPLPLGTVGEQADAERARKRDDRRRVLEAVDAAFDVHAFRDSDRTGLTETERLGLMTGYVLFCNDLVRLARPFVIAQSRASPSPAAPPPPSGAG